MQSPHWSAAVKVGILDLYKHLETGEKMKKFDLEKITYSPCTKDRDAIQAWFCFPCTYMVGMSSLGYLSLFKELDTNCDVNPERIFTDTEKTRFMPKNVELMGFSFSFEFDYLGVFKILDKYKIPLKSEERGENHPLVFAGGPVLSANPEPFAAFFDFVIVGDGENAFNEVVDAIKETRHLSKKEKLIRLSRIKGIYIPSFYDVTYNDDYSINSFEAKYREAPDIVEKRTTNNFQNCIYSPIVTSQSFFKDTFLVEVSRGCPRKCRFCMASYLNLPARYPSYQSIIDAIEIGLTKTNKIGLLGALIADHPYFEDICKYILKRREEKEFELSVSSLRADRISELAVKTLVACGQKHATIAIEAGTERLRKVINKNLSEDQIRESVKIARENGLKGLKIYGMLGLPSETMDDIVGLVNLMRVLKTENKGFDLTLSVSSFVPKALTPFQWASRENSKLIKEKNEFLKKELAMLGVKYKPTSARWDYVQTIISRGDRRLSSLIERTYKYNGTCDSFKKAYTELIEEGFDIPSLDWYTDRSVSLEETLAWDFIDSGISKANLAHEYKKALGLESKTQNDFGQIQKEEILLTKNHLI